MNTNKINISRVLRSFCREHVHFLASLTCGIAMGVLFSARVATYQAQYFQERYTPFQTSSSASTTVQSSEQSEQVLESREIMSFFSSYQAQSSESSHNTSRAVKKGTTTISRASSSTPQVARIRPVAQLIPASEESSSSQPAQEPSSSSSEQQASSVQQESSASSQSQEEHTEQPAEEPVIASASSSSSESSPATTDSSFPPFIRAAQPVNKVPNWGAMSTPAEWKRTYAQLTDADFVSVPAYNMSVLTIPMKSLANGDSVYPADIPTVTAKLYYSTRFMGKYDLDAGEYTGDHQGIDLKLALGTPVGAIGGGRVYSVSSDPRLGLHVVIEHRNESGQFFSVYAHLSSAKVATGDTVKPGQTIGFVGLTGMTTLAHLHLEVHQGAAPAADGLHAAAYEGSRVINPMTFIGRNGKM